MKKKVISLLLCLVMALSLIPTVAFGAGPQTQTFVDHIDVLVALNINGQKKSLDEDDLKNITITSTTSNFTVTERKLNGSTDAYGQTQARFKGTFPVGTKDNPVYYTLSLTKVVEGVSYDLTLTTQYWDENNFCPPTLNKMDNPLSGHNKTWTDGGVVSGSGIDVEFGTAYASTRQVIITKNILGVDTDDLVAGKSFTFTIYKGDGVTQVGSPLTAKTTTEYPSSANALTYLEPGTYVVKETASADYDNYTLSDTTYSGVDGTSTFVVGDNGGSLTVTNTYVKNAQETTSVTVTKVWNDDGVPDALKSKSVVVKLLANGVEVAGKTLTLSTDHPTDTFKDLPVKNEDGNDITYTVQEKDVPSGYSAAVTGSAANGFTITNTADWDSEQVKPASLTITKEDSKDKTKLLPGAEFTLTKQDDPTADTLWTRTETTDANGICTFSNLTEGTYTLTETAAPGGYKQTNQTWTIVVQKDEDKEPDIVWNTNKTKFQKVYDCTVSEKVENEDKGEAEYVSLTNGLTITNEKEPESYTVTLPIQKIVDKKVGSDNPGETKFTFVATKVDDQTETTTQYGLETITTKGVGTYNGELTINLRADLFPGGNGNIQLQVSELKGSDSKWLYDETVYPVWIMVQNYEVEIIVNPQIALLATADQEQEPTTLTFTNTYSYKYTPAPKPVTPTTVTSVKTGDMGVALYAGLAILSMTGSAGVILRRRKNDK